MASRGRRITAVGIIAAIGGFAFGAFLVRMIPASALSWVRPEHGWELGAYFLTITLAGFAALLCHELGHLGAGLAVGFRFALMIVGPIGLRRNEQGRVEPFLNRDLMAYGGLAATVPQEATVDLRSKFAKVIAAGPLTSLTLALVMALVIQVADTAQLPLPVGSRQILFAVLMFGLMNFAIFLATTIPMSMGYMPTDGARLLRLLRPGPAADEEMAVLKWLGHLTSGGSPGDIDRSTIRDLVIRPDEPNLGAVYIAYVACMSKHEFESVLPLLPQMAHCAQPLFESARDPVFAEVAFGFAVVARDKKKTMEYWNQVSDAYKSRDTMEGTRTKHAIAWLWGEREMEHRLQALRDRASKLGLQSRAAELALVETLAFVVEQRQSRFKSNDKQAKSNTQQAKKPAT